MIADMNFVGFAHLQLPEFLIFTLEIIPFFIKFISFYRWKMDFVNILSDIFDVIHSSEFIRLFNFGNNLKKKTTKQNKNSFFT